MRVSIECKELQGLDVEILAIYCRSIQEAIGYLILIWDRCFLENRLTLSREELAIASKCSTENDNFTKLLSGLIKGKWVVEQENGMFLVTRKEKDLKNINQLRKNASKGGKKKAENINNNKNLNGKISSLASARAKGRQLEEQKEGNCSSKSLAKPFPITTTITTTISSKERSSSIVPISSEEKNSTPEIINAAAQRQPAKPSASEPFQIKMKFCEEYKRKIGTDYAWDDGKDFKNAQRLLALKNVDLQKVLNCVEKFFIWPNSQVIDAGYVFSDGVNSFYLRFKELLADIACPERRVHAKASKIAFKELEEKVKNDAHYENVMRKMEEQDAYANKN